MAEIMTGRARLVSYGAAGLCVLAGVLCAILVAGGTGQMLALVLVGVGLVVATGLVFLEVGLSEDRARARERAAARRPLTRRPRPRRLRSHGPGGPPAPRR